jgi:hypothetical protein
MDQTKTNIVRAFLHGLTGAGLFKRLDYPGAPTEFIDSRTLEEIVKSGEFRQTCRTYGPYLRPIEGQDEISHNKPHDYAGTIELEKEEEIARSHR